jgi:hypothetical protein
MNRIELNRQEHVINNTNSGVKTRTNLQDEEILNKWMYRLAAKKYDLPSTTRSSFFIKRLQNHSDQVRLLIGRRKSIIMRSFPC